MPVTFDASFAGVHGFTSVPKALRWWGQDRLPFNGWTKSEWNSDTRWSFGQCVTFGAAAVSMLRAYGVPAELALFGYEDPDNPWADEAYGFAFAHAGALLGLSQDFVLDIHGLTPTEEALERWPDMWVGQDAVDFVNETMGENVYPAVFDRATLRRVRREIGDSLEEWYTQLSAA